MQQAQHASRKGFVPSENDAVMSVYPDIFWNPYDDKSPQDKATCEEEEKEEAELEEAEQAM